MVLRSETVYLLVEFQISIETLLIREDLKREKKGQSLRDSKRFVDTSLDMLTFILTS